MFNHILKRTKKANLLTRFRDKIMARIIINNISEKSYVNLLENMSKILKILNIGKYRYMSLYEIWPNIDNILPHLKFFR